MICYVCRGAAGVDMGCFKEYGRDGCMDTTQMFEDPFIDNYWFPFGMDGLSR
jgi:hypothetical protein